jgi:aminomethyltransferase
MIATARERRLLETPLHARLAAACETLQWYAWKGYASVQCFTTVQQEYFALRNSTGLFDLYPLTKYRIRGRDSRAFLDRLLTRNVVPMKARQAAYCLWCNDAGHVLDDGVLFCLAADDWRLCSQERHLDWFRWSARGFDVEVREETGTVSALAVQGPTSCRVLRNAGAAGLEQLPPFRHGEFRCAGIPLRISRTGFTGDLGYELWFEPEQSVTLWDALHAAGADHGLRPVGALAIDITRIEAGFLQAGVDFVPAEQAVRPDRARTPFELGLDRFVDLDKDHFNGRRALLEARQRGPARRVVLLDVAGPHPARDAFIHDRSRRNVGIVTSAAWSPSAKTSMAIATVRTTRGRVPDRLWAELYYRRELQWERVRAACRVVTGPFFDPPRRRATPAADF